MSLVLFNPSLAEVLVVLTFPYPLWVGNKRLECGLREVAALTHYVPRWIPAVFHLPFTSEETYS